MDPSKRKRADFKDKRFVDSGVWMGSDESGVSSALPSEDAPWGEDFLEGGRNAQAQALVQGRDSGSNSGSGAGNNELSVVQGRSVFRSVEEPVEHQLARNIVLDCLDKGQDSVDLRLVSLSL